ncbi:unnamed protein product [Darwinula stevensoni]|uniref:Formiminotransferase N-terminal subdomain domain-containing protein n=1 Tax=Darwinula stevensoni TaxID=69355 RepID=A0A7R9FRM3_9CRUS|nr:unnamed protein product [Darwinula stevensoni]CAG0901564.1 unnamed protein product [Darwinula stevensoni]
MLVGSPRAVVQATLGAAKVAWNLVDVTQHKGSHPRMGALDVCPFVPVRDATVADCVACSREFGRRLAEDLGVPVFLYGFASDRDYRKIMLPIRAGEFEGLDEKVTPIIRV